jgi:predicted DNA-binding protein (UPF0251 family)
MPRPRRRRRIGWRGQGHYFKPQGIPLAQLQTVELLAEEVEALRLKNILNLEQTEAADRMKISQTTFHRTLNSAYQKISQAIANGLAIKINK